MALERASTCEAGEMLALHMQYAGTVVVKPLRLTLERFANRPDFSYAFLETGDASPLGVEKRYRDDTTEFVKQVNEYDYLPDDSDDDEPKNPGVGHYCQRYFKGGVFVVAPTHGVYNKVDDYMGTAQTLGREGLRAQFQAYFEMLAASSYAPELRLVPLVRLLKSAENPRCVFTLEYINNNLLQRLIETDDILVNIRKRDDGKHSHTLNHSSIRDRILAGPSPERVSALKLLQEMSPEQRAEYLAFVNVGRGIVACDALSTNTALNLMSPSEDHYLLEKLGNGYFRRAIHRYGLEVVMPEKSSNEDSDECPQMKPV